jgi:carboxyl-terminal processing protease
MEGETAIRLTTAKYYTPSNRMIHDRGIEPDIVVPMSPDDWRKIRLDHAKSETPADLDDDLDPDDVKTDVKTDAKAAEKDEKVVDVQLQRAVDVLKGVMSFTAQLREPPVRKMAARQE